MQQIVWPISPKDVAKALAMQSFVNQCLQKHSVFKGKKKTQKAKFVASR